jgi:hypothetical protein
VNVAMKVPVEIRDKTVDQLNNCQLPERDSHHCRPPVPYGKFQIFCWCVNLMLGGSVLT